MSGMQPLGRRGAITCVSAAVLVICAVLLVRAERFLLPVVVLAVASVAVLAFSLGRRFLLYSVLVAMDLLVVFAYTWSLGETIHVVVHVTPTGYVANVGGVVRTYELPGTLVRRGVAAPTRLGLFVGSTNELIVTPTGTTDFTSARTPLDGLAQTLRFLIPDPGWTGLKVTYQASGGPHNLAVTRVRAVRGTWTSNVRGELTGSMGSLGMVRWSGARSFTFTANLVRPDGLLGVLVGPSLPNKGRILIVRMDRRQAWWYPWNGTGPGRWAQVAKGPDHSSRSRLFPWCNTRYACCFPASCWALFW